MRLSPHSLTTANARQGVGASHLTTYFERVYLNNWSMVKADAGEFVTRCHFLRPAVEAAEAAERMPLSIFVLQIEKAATPIKKMLLLICNTNV